MDISSLIKDISGKNASVIDSAIALIKQFYMLSK
jgi:hypothetical protein